MGASSDFICSLSLESRNDDLDTLLIEMKFKIEIKNLKYSGWEYR